MSETLSKSDLSVIDRLHIMTIRGFEPGKDLHADPETGATWDLTDQVMDPPGTANWFCDQVGMTADGEAWDSETTGILWTDYDCQPAWDFRVLVTDDFLQTLRLQVEKLGYRVARIDEVLDADVFGDGNGTVVILKHPEGWVIAR